MPPIINAQGFSKAFGASPLFHEISFTISEGDRIGLIGPNGSGKSTLLGVLAGRIEPDSGNVAVRKHTRLSYVVQESQFKSGDTVRSVVMKSLEHSAVPEAERAGRLFETLGRAGFEDFDAEASRLSGGWRKRLAIAEALVQQPDVLLLDEPTNHLDLEGIEWLEELLRTAQFACVVVSHDRYFLENVATQTVELNRAYPDGLLRVPGNYSEFLEKKEEFLLAQEKHQESLENRVRNEIEWLRRGPKARTTKAKARINTANQLIGELADLNTRTRTATTKIEFSATDRKTKRLVELDHVTYKVGERTLFAGLDFIITAGKRVGLVGPNGSGKTTLLRLLRGEIQPVSGEIRRADFLRVVYFDQNRVLDPEVTLRRALAPDSDSVIYQDRVVHVASWASRFLFTGEQLNQPVGRLSGGERARVLIAQLMLQPADVLLLDEPTNDLDIPTLEILEETLLEYTGALVLVTHDRYMLDRVSTVVLGLDGCGKASAFADYTQWEAWQAEQKKPVQNTAAQTTAPSRSAEPSAKKKLSYLEAREFATIEERIAQAEEVLQQKRAAAENPAIASDAQKLLTAHAELDETQKAVDQLYARWAELEGKLS
ncbi:MAG TPA: ABC-F family ATP-binding cassette domain-containing protein [Candidatus Angelobacter sp.]|nr:ABC-F family ATP-binding cassette domain-containing protein [Candidatus Angelobacter sp.]